MPKGNWDKQEGPDQSAIFQEIKNTETVNKGGIGFNTPAPTKGKSLADAVKFAKERAAQLHEDGAMKRLRPDKLIARFRRKIKMRRALDDRDYAMILLGNNGVIRKNIEVENGIRCIVKQSNEPDFVVIVEVEGENKESVDAATVMLNTAMFKGGIITDDSQVIEDEEVEHSNKRSAFDSNSKDITEVIQIPNQMVGMVIGKSGDTVKNIIATTHAHVQVQKDEETPPGAIYREVTITGDRLAVRDAKEAVKDLVEQKRLELANNGSSAPGTVKKVVQIPDSKVGLIIGRGGETCKNIMNRTNTNIYIPPIADSDNENVRSVTITGPPAGVQAAYSDIFALVQGQINADSLVSDEGPSCTIVVPDSKIGLVIGKGGIHLKEIQSIYNVRVVVPQTPDGTTNPAMRTLTLYGGPDMMEKAKDLILTNAGMKAAMPYLPPEYHFPSETPFYQPPVIPAGDIVEQWKTYYESMGTPLPPEYQAQLVEYQKQLVEYQRQIEEYNRQFQQQ